MSSNLKPVLARLAVGETLSEEESEQAFGIIMSGEATPAQIAGLLMAMRVRGETVSELTGAVRAMRARMTTVPAPPDAMDVVGTGGDNAGTLNISTAVSFVLAGAGFRSRNTAIARSAREPGRRAYSRRSASMWMCRSSGFRSSSRPPIAPFCSPPATTRRSGTRRARAWNSVQERSSTSWDQWRIEQERCGVS